MAINNQAFYNNQFQKLLQQDADFEAKTLQAQQSRDAAFNAPKEPWNPLETDWSWANDGQGLPDVVVNDRTSYETSNGTSNENSDIDPTYSLNFGLTKDSSNRDILNAVRGLKEYQNEGSQEQFNNWIGSQDGSNFDWANIANPANVFKDTNPEVLTYENQAFIQSVYDNIYKDNNTSNSVGSRPVAAYGYANPANYAMSTGYNNTTAGDQ